jgi:transcription initiation factor TFIIIB Brf1 subunit/transcription initiation factor TFIIB
MSYKEDICKHLNEVVDDREGTIICIDCGLVLSNSLFHEDRYLYSSSSNFSSNFSTNSDLEDIKELLERLNLPESFSSVIFENYRKVIKARKYSKYLLPFTIYQTLNEIGFPISIKNISAVSGISENLIYDMQHSEESIILNPESLLEKYCKIFEFDYKTYSLIKERLPKVNTGHNPLTIVASTIYKYCKDNSIKYSMKDIANTVNISPISIQRYLKKC